MSNNKITIKVSGTIEHVNNLVDFLPLDIVDCMSKAHKNSESSKSVHRFLKLDAKKLTELRERQKKASNHFLEGTI